MLSEYNFIIDDILDNKSFRELENMRHHGTTRMIHSKRVSYFSYKVCKFLNLDYISAARAGLLHDFFITDVNQTKVQRFISIFTHSKKALNNSMSSFDINKKEQNIIVSHMFPFCIYVPLYLESWIVDIVDDVVAIYEVLEKISVSMYYKKLYICSKLKKA